MGLRFQDLVFGAWGEDLRLRVVLFAWRCLDPRCPVYKNHVRCESCTGH